MPPNWCNYLRQPDTPSLPDEIHDDTQTGWRLGDDMFVKELGVRLERGLGFAEAGTQIEAKIDLGEDAPGYARRLAETAAQRLRARETGEHIRASGGVGSGPGARPRGVQSRPNRPRRSREDRPHQDPSSPRDKAMA